MICENWLQIFYDDLANENIWKIFGKYLHNEEGLGEKSYFEVSFRARKNMIAYKISHFSHTLFRFFDNKSFISKQYLEEIFFCESFYSFAPVKTCFDKFGPLLSEKSTVPKTYRDLQA